MTKEREGRTTTAMGSDAVTRLKKKHGAHVIQLASEAPAMEISFIPTGIFALDYALGGGFAAGRVHVVYGQKSSAKTTVLLKTIASAQKRCATCQGLPIDNKCKCGKFRETVVAYLDVEGTFDKNWAAKMGVDNTRLLFTRPEYAEQAIDVADALIRGGECDMICIDSIAFLSVAKELEESAEKIGVGAQARLMGIGVRKFTAALNWLANEHAGRKPTIMLVNQLRMKVGLMFGNPEVQPGGLAHGYAASSETLFRSGKYKMDESTDRPLYADFHFKVDKNKTATPKIEGDFRMMLSDTDHKQVGSSADEEVIAKLSEKYGLLERQGKSGAITFCGKQFRSMELVEQAMVEDRALYDQASEALMTIMLAL